MPLGYHSCPANLFRIGLSDIRPILAPINCLPPLGLIGATCTYILQYITLSSASCSRSHWATGGQASSVVTSSSHPHSGIRCPTHYSAHGSRLQLALFAPSLWDVVPHFTPHPHSGIWCPTYTLNFGPLTGSPRTPSSGSSAAPKQHDATAYGHSLALYSQRTRYLATLTAWPISTYRCLASWLPTQIQYPTSTVVANYNSTVINTPNLIIIQQLLIPLICQYMQQILI